MWNLLAEKRSLSHRTTWIFMLPAYDYLPIVAILDLPCTPNLLDALNIHLPTFGSPRIQLVGVYPPGRERRLGFATAELQRDTTLLVSLNRFASGSPHGVSSQPVHDCAQPQPADPASPMLAGSSAEEHIPGA